MNKCAPPENKTPRHSMEMGVMVVCNDCGRVMDATWIVRDEAPKQAILCVEKCKCDSPLLEF